MKTKNLIGHWVNLSRAYEIALLGSLKIQIVFNKEYKEGFDDYEYIKKFYQGVEFVKNGDLVVQIYKPEPIAGVDYESIATIKKRVQTARKNNIPTTFKNSSCDLLLQTAKNKLGLSLKQEEHVIKVAQIIAQLDGTKTIDVQHVAEAIQYLDYGGYDTVMCNAEDETLCFGKGIKIATYALYPDDIKTAINYLTSQLQEQI
jgi:hypothetical protein